MSVEIDEQEIDFGTLYADKRHRELLAAIKQLTAALSSKDVAIVSALNSNNKALQVFSAKLNEPVNTETKDPVVNIETNQEEVVKEAKNIIENQKKIIQLLEKRPTKLKIMRGADNRIDVVEVEYEAINKK